MKELFSMSTLGLLDLITGAAAADFVAPAPAPPVAVSGELIPAVIVQLGPTTPYSTIDCSEFTKLPDGTWKAFGSRRFGLGFVQGIVPPVRPIKVGAYIYNNIDLYSQLDEQCISSLVRARY